MRKVLVVVLVLAFITPAMADERLSFKATYDLAAVWADNINEQNTGVPQEDEDKNQFIYQRFRLGVNLKANDNVGAHLRFDFAENMWGQDQAFTSARADDSAELQVDRAYVSVKTEYVNIMGGLQFLPLGLTKVYRDNQPGLQLIIKTPVSVRLGYVKVSEGIGSGSDPFPSQLDRLSDDTDENKDTDRYFIDLGYKNKAFSVNGFFWQQKDNSENGVDNFKDEPYLAGLTVRSNFWDINFSGELATFGGDNGNGTDYTGTQLIVGGSKKMSDKLSLGFDAFYSTAAGTNEQKVTRVGNPFADYEICRGGHWNWDMLVYGRTNAHVFASSPPGGPLAGDVLDPFLTGAGSIGAGLGAKYQAMDKLTLMGIGHYMVAADDNIDGVTGEFESGFLLLGTAVYQLVPSASLHATYEYVNANFADDLDLDNAYMATLRLFIDF